MTPTANNESNKPPPRLLIQKTHAAFVSKLYAMVADADTNSLISWTSEGDCFQVTDPTEFSRKVLPVYFKHGNWQSFVRQLNMYGFHKINDLAYGGVYGDAQLWMFKHDCFQRGELKLLQNIKRRGTRPATATTPTPTPTPPPPPPSTTTQQEVEEEGPTDTGTAIVAQTYNPVIQNQNSAVVNTPSTTSAAVDNKDMPLNQQIQKLQKSVSNLHVINHKLQTENQEMRGAIQGYQSALTGIMKFLETAVVQPTTTTPSSEASNGAIVHAFRRLANDMEPVVGSSFRSHYSTLPPIRSDVSAQLYATAAFSSSSPTTTPNRLPSLSPSSTTTTTSTKIDMATVNGLLGNSRKRRTLSNGHSPPYNTGTDLEGDSLTSIPHIVLPSITGIVDNIPSSPSTNAHYYSYHRTTTTASHSSLRETLLPKKSRLA